MATKKSSRTKHNNKSRRKLWNILGGLVVVIVVIAVLASLPEQKDTAAINQSAWARQRIGYAQSQFNKVTGLNVTSSWNDTCSYDSEGLTSNSLDCITELDANYIVTSHVQAQNAELNIQKLVLSNQVFNVGNSLIGQDGEDFPIHSEGNMICDWYFNPPLRLIENGIKKAVAFSISCTVKTTTKVYHITNGG